MSAKDRVRWDKVYRQRARDPYPSPDPLLLEYTPPVDPDEGHTALDLAGGFGQNALWLASQGYSVDLMDISRVALQRARTEMVLKNIRNINLLQIDVDDVELKPEAYDLVTITRYLKRDLFEAIKASVKPGGRVIYTTFNIHYLDVVPEFNTAFLLDVGELRRYFTSWTLLYDEEIDHNSYLVAVKPG